MDKFIKDRIFNYMKHNLDVNSLDYIERDSEIDVRDIRRALKYYDDGNILLSTYYAIKSDMYELLDKIIDENDNLDEIKKVIIRSDKNYENSKLKITINDYIDNIDSIIKNNRVNIFEKIIDKEEIVIQHHILNMSVDIYKVYEKYFEVNEYTAYDLIEQLILDKGDVELTKYMINKYIYDFFDEEQDELIYSAIEFNPKLIDFILCITNNYDLIDKYLTYAVKFDHNEYIDILEKY